MTTPDTSESVTAVKNQPLHRELGLWNALSFAAGLTLVVTFFMPTVSDTRSTTPAHLIRQELCDWWCAPDTPISDAFFTFCCFAACYLAGGLMAAAGAARWAGRPRVARALSVPLAILLALIGAGLLWMAPVYHGDDFRNGEWWSLPKTMVGGLAILIYLTWASRFGLQTARFYEFAAALASMSYFLHLSFGLPVSFGPYASLVASVLLLIATVGAAKATSRDSWWAAVWQLLTCQILCVSLTPDWLFERSRPGSEGVPSETPATSVGLP